MGKRMIKVGVANQEAELSIDIKDFEEWEPTKVSYIGTAIYFKIEKDETFYSMDSDDFRGIFTLKDKKWAYLGQ